MLRDNFFYILLGFIAIILIGVTIGLQLMLLSGRSADEPSTADSSSITQPATVENGSDANVSDEQAVAMVINTPTSTPIVIAVEPIDSSATSASIIVEVTATPVQSADISITEPLPTDLLPIEPSPTVTPLTASLPEEPLPTDTVQPTQPLPTATVVTIDPTSTPFLAADFEFAYVDSRPECVLVTNVVANLFEEWGWSTRQVQFASIADIFDVTLYQDENETRPDLTFCYRDPEDREQFLAQDGSDLELISSGYTQVEEQKYYILAHSSVPVQLRYENACILDFLKNLEISDTSLNTSSSAQWLAENADLVETWGTCTAGR